MSYQTSSKRPPPLWLLIGARKLVFFWHQSEARTAATVWNWSGKTLSPGALLAILYFSSFHIYFSARLDFLSPPLSAPGSPRMYSTVQSVKNVAVLMEDGVFALFFCPHPGGFDRSRVPTPGNLASKAKKVLTARAQLEFTNALNWSLIRQN